MKISAISRELQSEKGEKKMVQTFLSGLKNQGFGRQEDFQVQAGLELFFLIILQRVCITQDFSGLLKLYYAIFRPKFG